MTTFLWALCSIAIAIFIKFYLWPYLFNKWTLWRCQRVLRGIVKRNPNLTPKGKEDIEALIKMMGEISKEETI